MDPSADPNADQTDPNELLRSAVVSSLGQAAASQTQHEQNGVDDPSHAAGSDGVDPTANHQGQDHDGDQQMTIADIPHLFPPTSAADETPAKKRGRKASPSSTPAGGKRGKTGASPSEVVDPVEKKIRQREANRKAAERSRGKKRGEL
jgi:hypothetical protein